MLTAALCASGVARAEVYEVKAGDDWSLLGPKLVAGDEVILLEGVHVPAQFTGLAGEPGRPIVLRGGDPAKLVEIASSREAIKLTDCRHVRVERILAKGMRRAGFVVDATAGGSCGDIVVQDVLVQDVDGLAEQAGLVVLGAERVTLLRSRFEDCRGSAIHLECATDFRAERLQIHAGAGANTAFGVQVLGASSELRFNDLWIWGSVRTGISIGAKDAIARAPRVPVVPEAATPARDAAPTPPQAERRDAVAPPAGSTAKDPPSAPSASPVAPAGSGAPGAPAPRPAMVRDAMFERLLVRDTDHAFEFGSCDGVTIANSTVVDASASIFRLVRPAKGQPGASVRFRENIVTWEVGALRQLVAPVEGTPTAGLRLGPNIWWSRELPSALPLLGPEGNPFQGTLEVPQTIDIDPDLDDRSLPRTEAAKMFGRRVD